MRLACWICYRIKTWIRERYFLNIGKYRSLIQARFCGLLAVLGASTHKPLGADKKIAPELCVAFTRFLFPLQIMRGVDVATFEHIHVLSVELIHSYKGKDPGASVS